MNKELEAVLNYILNSNGVPKKALKRTKRMKIGLFGKTSNSEVNIDSEEVSIKVFNTNDNSNVSMELFHESTSERNEFYALVNKTSELEELSLFSDRNSRLFYIIVFEDKIRISSEQYLLEI